MLNDATHSLVKSRGRWWQDVLRQDQNRSHLVPHPPHTTPGQVLPKALLLSFAVSPYTDVTALGCKRIDFRQNRVKRMGWEQACYILESHGVSAHYTTYWEDTSWMSSLIDGSLWALDMQCETNPVASLDTMFKGLRRCIHLFGNKQLLFWKLIFFER